jgi:hypothetical protein
MRTGSDNFCLNCDKDWVIIPLLLQVSRNICWFMRDSYSIYSNPVWHWKEMIIIVFIAIMPSVLEPLSKKKEFKCNVFINTVLSKLVKEKQRFTRCHFDRGFIINMNNSICYNGQKLISELTTRNIVRAQHLLSFSDLSPCNFWFFLFLEKSMKKMELLIENELIQLLLESDRDYFRIRPICFQKMNPMIFLSY